jgi:riboflavin synthase
MFTGIIQAIGRIRHIEPQAGDVRLHVETGTLAMGDVQLGDSIAVNGACLTVVTRGQGHFAADVSHETLNVTTLGALKPGSRVNLEKALTLNAPLGGHLVSGHVDGMGRLLERRADGRSVRLRVAAPAGLARYIAPKGSICLDGVSLTVNRVDGLHFEINIVPHTLQQTIINEYQAGSQINLEVDLIARYLERLLLGERAAESTINAGISAEFLAQHGFIGGGL